MKKLLVMGMSLISMGLLVACGQPESPVTSNPSSEPSTPSGDTSGSTPGTSGSESTPVENKDTIYFKDVAWWSADGARTGIYLWTGTGDVKNAAWPGEAMESVGNGIWKYTFAADSVYTKFIFTRIGPDSLADYGAKTPDLNVEDIDFSKPLYDISGVTDPVWGDPGVTGVWTAYNA